MNANKPLRYWVEIDGRTFPLREARGHEGVSRVSRFDLALRSPDPTFADPDELIRKDAQIHLEREGGARLRTITGIVTEASIEAVMNGAPEVTLTVEPRLSLSRLRTDNRVFRDRTVPQMVVEVLAAIGVSPALRLRQSYPERPYTVQRDETDFAFVSRLMEDEGIFYFLDDNDQMVLGDSAAAYAPIDGDQVLPFYTSSGLDVPDESVHVAGERAEMSAGRVNLRDFRADHPNLDMDVGMPVPKLDDDQPEGPEYYEYPGGYADPAEGTRRAQKMSEAFACAAAGTVGKSTSARLAPGRTFKLVDAPDVRDGEYVVTAVEHRFDRDSSFSNGFSALDAEIGIRPPRQTPSPVLVNPVTGFVTTPAGEDDIHTDGTGRVKIHFHWDRKQPFDDHCSDWIPVLQDNTGHSSSVPRRGWEMLVHFLEGNPDRPVVLGRVYNGDDPFPAPLPASKTQTALKSLSSPGAVGSNHLVMDDLAGAERIMLQAERNHDMVTAHDKKEDVLSNERVAVDRDEAVTIGLTHTASIGLSSELKVDNNQTLATGQNRAVKIGKTSVATVGGNHEMTIGAAHMRKIGGDDKVAASVVDEKVGALILETALKTNATMAGATASLTVGGSLTEAAKNDKSETAGAGRIETIKGDLFSDAGARMVTVTEQKRSTKVGDVLEVAATGSLDLRGAEKVTVSTKDFTLAADTSLALKVGNTLVSMKDGLIDIVSKTITVTVSGPNTQGS
ncbi:MAG: type VI secretion system tip protein TssI/VgrG [Byssovorax sp.]